MTRIGMDLEHPDEVPYVNWDSPVTNAEVRRVLLEGSDFIAAELVKAQLRRGQRRALYYFRDQQGLEVDFVVPGKGGISS